MSILIAPSVIGKGFVLEEIFLSSQTSLFPYL